MKRAIFPGSFDPFHKGHLKVVDKASKLFDELIIIVAINNEKKHEKDLTDRQEVIQKQIASYSNVTVDILKEGLVAEYALKHKINYLVRSGRNNIDFDYELQMGKVNKKINEQLETILIIPDYEDIELSSSVFKKIYDKH